MTRIRNYIFTVGTSFLGTAVSTITGLVSVPMSLHYWQNERFGLWALVNSILVYLSVFNLGLDSSAGTLMAKNESPKLKQRVLRRTLVLMGGSALVGLAAYGVSVAVGVDWVAVLGKVPAELRTEAFQCLSVMIGFYFLNMPFSLSSAICTGYQKVYIDRLFNVLQSLTLFISLILVVALHGDLVAYAAINGFATLVLNAVKALTVRRVVVIGGASLPDVPGQRTDAEYRTIIQTGGRFFLIGIAAMVVWNTDYFVISRLLGLRSVTPYSIAFKLFNIVFSVVTIMNTSALSLMSREYARSNWRWLNTAYNSILSTVATVGGCVLIGGVYFARDIVVAWTGSPDNYAGILTVCALGGYSYLLCIVNLNSGMLNAFNLNKGLPLIGFCEAAIKITLSIALLRRVGIGGVALGTLLGSLLSPTLVLPLLISRRSGGKIRCSLRFVLVQALAILVPLAAVGVFLQTRKGLAGLRVAAGVLSICVFVSLSWILVPAQARTYLISIAKTLAVRGRRNG